MFTFLDLFSGIGGFRIPLENLGGKCIGFSEIDQDAIQVYKNNFNTKNEIDFGDIKNISKKVPYCDVMTGGVPCQSWSVAGKKQGFDDERGQLWFDVIHLVEVNKPKVFIFENVKGLADPKHRKSLHFIKQEFSKIGYEVYSQVLNAYDFGLPQNRDRIFLVGIKKSIDKYRNFTFPIPIQSKPKLYEFLDEDVKVYKTHLNKKTFNPHEIFGKKIPYSRNRFQKLEHLNDFFIFCDTRDGHSTIHSWDLIKTTKKEKKICFALLRNRRKKVYGDFDGNPLSYLDLKDLIPDLNKEDLKRLIEKEILREVDKKFDLVNTKNSAGLNSIYRVFLPQSDIFSTLTASGTNDFIATKTILQNNVKNYKELFLDKIYYPGYYRPITSKEASRLQGFPDEFKIHEKKRLAMKQFGNAVPTNVVYHLMKAIIDYGVLHQDRKVQPSKNQQLSLLS